jgi:hypothetical protein
MRGDRGQSAEIVIRVAIDVVIAVALDCAAAGRVHSSTIPRDHGMRDPKNDATPIRLKSGLVVAGNDIAHDDGGWPIAERCPRIGAGTGVVGSLAVDDRDIERSPERRHDESGAVIVRRDFAEHAGDRPSVASDCDPVKAVIGSNRIRHREAHRRARRRHRPDSNTPKREIPDDAVFDGEISARVEPDAVRCSAASSFDGQAAQMDAVARAGIDHDGRQALSDPDGRDPDAVVDDADRLSDGHLAIAGRIEHVDLAAGGGLGERKGKVRHGAANAQEPLSVPCPETQLRFGPACAGAAERPQARRAAAMVGNDVILIMARPPSNAE